MNIMTYLMDPIRIGIVIANITAWILSYRYFRKTLKEWKKMQQEIQKKGDELVPRDVSKRVVIIGPSKAGKTTIAKGLRHALVRRGFVQRTSVMPLTKTKGIRYYVFDRVRKGEEKIGILTDTVVIADFAGEIKPSVDEEEATVEFNPVQVKELKNADIIIEVIYWKENPEDKDDSLKEIRKMLSLYDLAIKKALGILGKRNYINVDKELYRVVTHLDESKKIRSNKEIKIIIQRNAGIPHTVFRKHMIIPTNPKQFVERYENDTRTEPDQLEKNYGIDILVNAIINRDKIVGKTTKGGEKR